MKEILDEQSRLFMEHNILITCFNYKTPTGSRFRFYAKKLDIPDNGIAVPEPTEKDPNNKIIILPLHNPKDIDLKTGAVNIPSFEDYYEGLQDQIDKCKEYYRVK